MQMLPLHPVAYAEICKGRGLEPKVSKLKATSVNEENNR